MHKSIVLLTALAWLSGCAVGPDYQPVQPDAPERFLEAPRASAGSADEQRFWAGFEDPMLAGLIRQTLDANRHLQRGQIGAGGAQLGPLRFAGAA